MRSIILVFLVFLITALPIYAQGTWEQINEINGQELTWVGKIVNDGNGGMWVRASAGVFLFMDGVWTDYSDSLFSVNDIEVDSNGDIWFSEGGSLAKYDGFHFERFYPDPQFSFFDIYNIELQQTGVVWIYSAYYHDDGILRFDGVEWRQFTTDDGLLSNNIFNIKASTAGELWVSYGTPIFFESGYLCYGVSKYDGETWQTYDTTNGINSDRVMGIAFANNGDVFISYVYDHNGIAGGISKFNGTSWEWLTNNYWGYSLIFDPKDNLWGNFENHLDTGIEQIIGIYDGISWSSFIPPTQGSGPSAFDDEGRAWFSGESIQILTLDDVYVADSPQPQVIQLLPNYPNPFNLATTIQYNLSENAQVRLSVYSITGQKIIILVDGLMRAGEHSVRFDGSLLPSGIYVVKLEANGLIKTNKIMLVK